MQCRKYCSRPRIIVVKEQPNKAFGTVKKNVMGARTGKAKMKCVIEMAYKQ